MSYFFDHLKAVTIIILFCLAEYRLLVYMVEPSDPCFVLIGFISVLTGFVLCAFYLFDFLAVMANKNKDEDEE